MQVGVWWIDEVISRWSDGDWTLLSLTRATVWWLLFLPVLVCPPVRIAAARFARRNPRLSAAVSFLLAAAVTLLWFWPLTTIAWGLTDDYEWLNLLDSQGRFSSEALWKRIGEHPEVGGCWNRDWNLARFRPLYYLIRFGELWFWGGNSQGLGLNRMLCVFLFLWGTQRALRNFTDPLYAWLMTLSLMVFPCWSDIWPRLGPSEAYAAASLACFMWGFSLLWKPPVAHLDHRKFSASFPWILMTFGAIASFFFKENFAVLIIPSIAVYLRQLWFRRPIPWAGHVGLILTLAALAFLATVLKFKLGLVRHETIYGQSTQLEKLFQAGGTGCLAYCRTLSGVWAVAFNLLVLLAIGWGTVQKKLGGKAVKRLILTLLAVWLIGLSFYLSQYIFYSGDLNGRYGFPAEFAGYLMMAALAWSFTRSSLLREFANSRQRIWWRRAAVCVAFFPAFIFGPHHLPVDARKSIDKGIEVRHFVEMIAARCRQDQATPLILEAVQPYCCEQVLQGVPIALRQLGVKNPFYLRFDTPDARTASQFPPYFQKCIPVMQDVSQKGGYGFLAWPRKETLPFQKALIVTMDADQPHAPGEFLGRIPH
ncbi:MAG: hypothetical protein U0903_02045 [Planctomycetales bacterium]